MAAKGEGLRAGGPGIGMPGFSSPSPSPEALDLLSRGAAELGLNLDPLALDRLTGYLAELKRWNARVNLTGLRTDRDLVIRLFLDSLALEPFLGEALTLLDIGSGAGFPGLVLKLVHPSLSLTLVESRGKKAAFLDYLASLWRLEKVAVVHARLTPRLARDWGPRYDVVVSRAAMPLGELMAVAAYVLNPGGRLLAPKGPRLDPKEFEDARVKARPYGFRPLEACSYRLPLVGEAKLLIKAVKSGDPG